MSTVTKYVWHIDLLLTLSRIFSRDPIFMEGQSARSTIRGWPFALALSRV